MPTRVAAAFVALALALFAAPDPAAATDSIAAVDRSTRQVGGAGASCIGSNSVRVIYGVSVARGVVHAQAFVNTAGRDRAVSLLTRGVAPADIIEIITAADFDSLAEQRQYGVVDLDNTPAAFTGDDNGEFAGDRQGDDGTFAFTVQGNILTGVDVIERAADAFEDGGCDLADRLMRALEAGGENGEGDSRCTGSGIPADSGFIQVDLPGQAPGSYLRLEVIATGNNDNPVVLLREQYDEWRADNPCPSAKPDAAPEPGEDAGPPDAGSGGGGGTGGNDAGPPGGDETADDGGCGCGAADRGSDWRVRLLLLALALALVRRGLR